MTLGGVLQSIRVLDLTNDTGRFATKLLTEAGASVIRRAQFRGVRGLTRNESRSHCCGAWGWIIYVMSACPTICPSKRDDAVNKKDRKKNATAVAE
jgi:hypothetical protein